MCVEIEAAHRCDFVPPPLDAGRRRHAESVDVEDAAANTVLGNLGDRRNARVAHLIEPPRRLGEAPFLFTDLDHEPRLLQRRGDRCALGARTRCRDQDAHRSPHQRLERFDPLAGKLVVRLLGAQCLALRVQGGALSPKQCLEVREPALRVCRGGGDDREDALRQRAHECGQQHRSARPRKAAHADALAGRRQALDQRARGGQVVELLQ